MTRVWRPINKSLAGLFVAATFAFPQTTTTARPGTLNYVEGRAYIDDREVDQKQAGHLNLDVNQVLRTGPNSKAELLLTPGVFLRLGDNSQVKMISASLTDTKVAVMQGEALIEAAELFKENNIQILGSGSSTKLLKSGLYRFNADTGQVAVIDGKVDVQRGDGHIELGRGHEVALASATLKAEKFNTKQEDDLYAWSNLRSEYAAEASYATAKNVAVYNYGWGTGWFWNPWYSSWAFVPWGGYLYDPFGWGFFSPGYLPYASVYYAPWRHGVVPVNPTHVPAGVTFRGAGVRPGLSASVRSVPMSRPMGGGFGGGHMGGGGGRR
jgi:FecR protein